MAPLPTDSSTNCGFMGNIQEVEPFAVGDTLIPVFGISGVMVPYGDTTDHYSYLLTGQGAAMEENPLSSAFVAQTLLDSHIPQFLHEAVNGVVKYILDLCINKFT